ncbi:flagellar export chaperone FliS [Desulfoplanes formicivorans]|uniref:Flagellar secretion chaperone FliS n=1 Tax=Desulfoplanes formicivorans TaxID=1592317 RepID=A0A194AEE6_9BACT|nr:flagellar export chaperone FliS [Desulfoplanes formicivorans]GAU07575.1 flagellar biosynthesis protein FliS [Desulfoplanes formicivorans]
MRYNAAQAYLKTQVTTTSQEELVIMLYDAAIKFLNRAKIKIKERDMAQKGILISKALDIIAELDGSLNVKQGGELAKNLHTMYFYCNTRLLKANIELNTEIIDEVIHILSQFRSAFAEILPGAKHSTSAPASQASLY